MGGGSLSAQREIVEMPCILIDQPIGNYYIGSIDYRDLIDITTVDVRQISEMQDGIYSYTGIQRKLNKARAKKIGEYTNTADPCFPTAVVLSVDGRCIEYMSDKAMLRLRSDPGDPENGIDPIEFDQIARIIDGQHRIAGLRHCRKERFDINVSIFVDIDPAVEGYIFSTVNLHQSKVSSSLAYDLYALTNKRSPQKLCHNIAVALDAKDESPFRNKIKRLGVAEPHNIPASITQAAFVKSLMKYISVDPMKDRDVYIRGKKPSRASGSQAEKLIFRDFMIDERDLELATILLNYFSAAAERWPVAWNSPDKGIMLSRTNGFQALMRFLRPAYNEFAEDVPSKAQFGEVFSRVSLADKDFDTSRYAPGSSGEVALARDLIEMSGVDPKARKRQSSLI